MDDSSFFQAAFSTQQRDDAALLVRFEMADVVDHEKTKLAGYPVFRQVERIRIRIPGSQEERVDKANADYKRRFPAAYAAFKAGADVPAGGTPLEAWAGVTKGDVAMLKHHGVASVEQLSAISDENMSNMGHGVRPIRDRAKVWLEARKAHQPVAELTAKLEEERSKRLALEERLAVLESGQPAPKPKRIRKKAEKPLEG